MKKKILCLLFMIILLLSGCNNKKNILKEIEKKYNNLKTYNIEGTLTVNNNEDTYTYNVNVKYKKKDNYYVSLINKNNNYEQIILKNMDALYIITPSLNKSFKFQSNWPYNTSQIYLIDSIIKDIKNDKERNLIKSDKEYVYETKVNYPNNRNLVNQIVTFDKNFNIKKVSVVSLDGIEQMKMVFDKVTLNKEVADNTFNLNNLIKDYDINDNKVSSSLDDSIYPLYIPTGTVLDKSEKVSKDNGERIIMTFKGEKPFLLVEETSDILKEFTTIPTYGEPYLLLDTVGSITEDSITWSSSGIDYYLVSDVMSKDELVEIAKSVVSIPISK